MAEKFKKSKPLFDQLTIIIYIFYYRKTEIEQIFTSENLEPPNVAKYFSSDIPLVFSNLLWSACWVLSCEVRRHMHDWDQHST